MLDERKFNERIVCARPIAEEFLRLSINVFGANVAGDTSAVLFGT